MILQPQQVYNLARDAGFTSDQCPTVLGTIKAESGFNPFALGLNPGSNASVDRGLAQINSYWHSETTDEECLTPNLALKAMYRISSGGTDFSPWYGWTKGLGPQYAVQFRLQRAEMEANYKAPSSAPDYRDFAAASASAVHDLRNGFSLSSLIQPDKDVIKAVANLL